MTETGWETCRFCAAPLDGSPAAPKAEWVQAERKAAAQAAAAAARPLRQRKPTDWGRIGVVLVLVAAIAGGGLLAKNELMPSQPYPSHWDPRVRPFVAFIEREHDMAFKHPVHTEFLPSAAFDAQVREYLAETSDGERPSWEQRLAVLKAVGLAGPKAKVTGEGADGVAEIMGLYQPDKQRLLVRGNDLNPIVASTAVHELTHALHDQYYDLGRITLLSNDGEAEMLDALTEGDAERMADRYLATLVEGDLVAMDKAARELSKDIRLATKEVKATGLPDVLAVFGAAPYVLGNEMTRAIVGSGQEQMLDEIFTYRPESAEGMMDPVAVIREEEPAAVRLPLLGKGERRIDNGKLGPLTIYVMLAARIPPHQALQASDGWNGDAMVAFRKGGRDCVRVAYRGDTAADGAELAGALNAWAGTLPPGSLRLRAAGSSVTFDACAKWTGPPPNGDEVLNLPYFRNWVVADMFDHDEMLANVFGSMPPDRVDCVVDHAIAQTPLAFVVDPENQPTPGWMINPSPLIDGCP